MTRVTWTPQAKRDRFAQLADIAECNPGAAIRLGDRIRTAVARLADHPASGRPGRLHDTRELPILGTSYLAIYRVTRSGVLILRLIHGAQDWPPRRNSGD